MNVVGWAGAACEYTYEKYIIANYVEVSSMNTVIKCIIMNALIKYMEVNSVNTLTEVQLMNTLTKFSEVCYQVRKCI